MILEERTGRSIETRLATKQTVTKMWDLKDFLSEHQAQLAQND